MALSFQEVVSDGSLSFIDVAFPYIKREHVFVDFNGEATAPGVWAWHTVTPNRIVFASQVPAGVQVRVKRQTAANAVRHTYTLGAGFTFSTLDDNFRQILYLAQEGKEQGFTTPAVDLEIRELLAKHLAESISVSSFGAKGDGVTDDTAAIQAAITYAFQNTIGEVYMPAGTYKITKPIYVWGSNNYIRTGVRLVGSGLQATTIKKSGNGTPADGSWNANIDAVVIFSPYPANTTGAQLPTGTYNAALADLSIEGTSGTPNAFGLYTQDDFGQIKVERVCILGQTTTFRTDANMWLTAWKNVSLHPITNGFWMDKSGTSVNLTNVYVLGGGANGGIGFNLQSLYSHGESVACEGFLGTQFQFRFAGWTVNGLGVESAAASGRAIGVSNSSTVTVSSALILCPNGVEVATGCALKLVGPQFGDEFAPTTRSGNLWFVAGTGALCIENLRNFDTFSAANTGFAMVTELSGTQPYSVRGLDVHSITNDNSANAMRVRNLSGTPLLQVRNDGALFTGLAAASPYNNTSAAAANCGIDPAGILYRSTSSIRYKKNVQDAAHGLSHVLQLRPVTYEGTAEADKGRRFGGLIAEDVHAVGLSEFVVYDEQGRPEALAYAHMVSLLIKAVQELNSKVEALSNCKAGKE